MDIQAKKLELIQLLLKTNDPQIISSMLSIFKYQEKKDFWLEMDPEQKKEIELGLKEIQAGQTVDYEDLIKKHRQ